MGNTFLVMERRSKYSFPFVVAEVKRLIEESTKHG